MHRTAVSAAAALFISAGAAFAGDADVVRSFYAEFLNPGGDLGKAEEILAEGWKSKGGYTGPAKTTEAFIKQMGGFRGAVPDMAFVVQDLVESGDTYVVRSRATGTPVAPIFGFDTGGRSFDILAIDIHTVEDGKIVETWHVEDWSSAVEQLKAE